MRIDDVRHAVHRHPFRPFAIKTADGARYDVSHPDLVMVHPGSQRTVIVGTGPDEHVVLDPVLITALEYASSNGEPGNGQA